MNINCLKLASLVTMIPWHYLELCGTYFFTLHFGLQGRDEHRKLCFKDTALFTDSENGSEYAQYLFECGTKTQRGEVGPPRELLHQR